MRLENPVKSLGTRFSWSTGLGKKILEAETGRHLELGYVANAHPRFEQILALPSPLEARHEVQTSLEVHVAVSPSSIAVEVDDGQP